MDMSLATMSSNVSCRCPQWRYGMRSTALDRSVGLRQLTGTGHSIPPSASISRRKSPGVVCAAQLQAPSPPYAEGVHDFPPWIGGGPLSSALNALISFSPLYSLMKVGARQMLISTAERNSVPWRDIVEELRSSPELAKEKEAVENKEGIDYPEYYLQRFHAYDAGNLCWEAAYELEPATLSMCQRAIPWAPSPQAAAHFLRSAWLAAIQAHREAHAAGAPVSSILDVGCSAGISTRHLAEAYPSAQVTGLDASPFFLAVASHRAKQQSAAGARPAKPIQWMHALGESTGLPSHSFSLVSFAFVFHECPPAAIRALLLEAKRLLQPGGTVAITDNSPKSKIIQDLPTPLATLMKSTEPHADSYYQLHLEGLMEDLGFRHVTTVLSDPRHRTVTASA